jgi:hypothetical protein
MSPAMGHLDAGDGNSGSPHQNGKASQDSAAEIITLSSAEATFLGIGHARQSSDLVPDFGFS